MTDLVFAEAANRHRATKTYTEEKAMRNLFFTLIAITFSISAHAKYTTSRNFVTLLQDPQIIAIEDQMAERGLELIQVVDSELRYRCICNDYKLVFKNTSTGETVEKYARLLQGKVRVEAE